MTTFLLSHAARQPPPDVRRKSRPRRGTTTRRSSTCSATRAGSARVLVFFAPDCPASIPALPPSPRGVGPDEQIGPRDE